MYLAAPNADTNNRPLVHVYAVGWGS
jgi:hypothetical protein